MQSFFKLKARNFKGFIHGFISLPSVLISQVGGKNYY